MKTLYFDCISGISGDMAVGALIDLGVKPSTLEWELSKLDLGEYHVHVDRAERQGIGGVAFSVHTGATHSHGCGHEHDHGHEHTHDHDHDHGTEAHAHHHHHHHDCDHEHDHDHEHAEKGEDHDHDLEDLDHDHGAEVTAHQAHAHHAHGRSHREIRELLSGSDLTPFVRKHALSIFQRIAEAEGKIHGMPPESVTFHEVGALDSIVDIVAFCVGLEELGVDSIHVSPLREGRGWIDCAHGKLPIPSPATLELLRGISLEQIDEPYELITPTGAAFLAEFGTGFGPMPRMLVDRVGYGVGTRVIPNRPNVLRAIIGESDASALNPVDTVFQIECNIDDMNPEILGAVVDKLFAEGALDAYLTPVYMKKNRAATLLTALVDSELKEQITDLIFRETSTFGIRISEVNREKLARRFETVETVWGAVQIKIGERSGEIVQVSPEFESAKRVSTASGQPLQAVFEAAMAAYRQKK